MHQTEFQQKMLAKYGRTIVGMDATYKVCKWSFPFYLLTVVTNHGHAFPVAMFFMEHESGAGIAEALKILRSWNPRTVTWRMPSPSSAPFITTGVGVMTRSAESWQA